VQIVVKWIMLKSKFIFAQLYFSLVKLFDVAVGALDAKLLNNNKYRLWKNYLLSTNDWHMPLYHQITYCKFWKQYSYNL